MDRLTRTLLGRALLCLVLLAGQQAAFAHPIAHVFASQGRHATFDAAPQSGDPAAPSELCGFHSSLSAVLGAIAQAAQCFVPPAVIGVAYPAPARLSIPLPPPPSASRDPPLHS